PSPRDCPCRDRSRVCGPWHYVVGGGAGLAREERGVLSDGARGGLALFARSRFNCAMKHAGQAALDRLEPFLPHLRELEELREKSRGVFYRQGRAFLHFHEDPKGLFADVRLADDFERLEATSIAQRAVLLRRIRAGLAAGKKQSAR